jgi:hypothetical protein
MVFSLLELKAPCRQSLVFIYKVGVPIVWGNCLEDAVSFTRGEIVLGGCGSLPTPHLDNLLQRSTFHPAQNVGTFAGNGEFL